LKEKCLNLEKSLKHDICKEEANLVDYGPKLIVEGEICQVDHQFVGLTLIYLRKIKLVFFYGLPTYYVIQICNPCIRLRVGIIIRKIYFIL